MVNVKIIKVDKNIVGFEIEGHALPEGITGDDNDMICNSISILSQSVIIGIEEVLSLKPNYVVEDGYLKLDISGFNEEDLEKSQVLLKTFEHSVESTIIGLDNSLGKKRRLKYINIVKEEV